MAILNLKVENRSNQYDGITNELFDPNNARNHVLYSIVGQTIKKIISSLAGGSHLGFGALTGVARIFERGTPARFFL